MSVHLSLAAPVQLAGHAHVIGSLDPVPDTETAKLMPRLHQHLTNGADPATALHTTRTWTHTSP